MGSQGMVTTLEECAEGCLDTAGCVAVTVYWHQGGPGEGLCRYFSNCANTYGEGDTETVIDVAECEYASNTISNPLVQWNINYTPESDYYGCDEIRYKVVNPNNDNGESEEATISIIINPVNDLPELTSVSDVEINEDGVAVVEVNYSDPDNALALSVTSSNSSINVEQNNRSNDPLFDGVVFHIDADNWSGSGALASEVGGYSAYPEGSPALEIIDDVTGITFNSDSDAFNFWDFDPNHDVLPSATFELWVYVQSIPNDRGWIMGTENGGCDHIPVGVLPKPELTRHDEVVPPLRLSCSKR
jgi:hypothetical protein